jgi:8-oxo-dGTP diphosphatase
MSTVIVAAGILIEGGRVLLTQRKRGAHLAGMWEFPGGKVESGEDPKEALRRELMEELGIEVSVGAIVEVTFHRYDEADKAVLLLFYEVVRTSGEPVARDVAAFRWADAGGLDPALFPPADVDVLRAVHARLGR